MSVMICERHTATRKATLSWFEKRMLNLELPGRRKRARAQSGLMDAVKENLQRLR